MNTNNYDELNVKLDVYKSSKEREVGSFIERSFNRRLEFKLIIGSTFIRILVKVLLGLLFLISNKSNIFRLVKRSAIACMDIFLIRRIEYGKKLKSYFIYT